MPLDNFDHEIDDPTGEFDNAMETLGQLLIVFLSLGLLLTLWWMFA